MATSSDIVREGFLCPICVQDLGSFHRLQNHFETAHSAEDKAVLDQVKGLFSKAKGKILGKHEDSQLTEEAHVNNSSDLHQTIWEPQENGVTRSHFDFYKRTRDARIDRFVIESNKVLIRLDKLLGHVRLTGKRNSKEFEQNLVPWVRDDDVPFCPTCGDRFNLARRRHHCRLCGAIMCKKCSLYVSFDLAETLVQTLRRTSFTRPRSQSVSIYPQASAPSAENDSKVRCCHDCNRILLKRKEKLDEQDRQPLLVALYEKLHKAKVDAERLAPEYKQMASSLNQGEEHYELGKANELRLKVMKLYETVDVLSKKIAALNTGDEENPPPPAALRLQNSVRRACHAYLQDNMLTLQSLPSLPKLELLQKERRKEQERKMRRQRETAERERAEAKRLQELERMRSERDAVESQAQQRTVAKPRENMRHKTHREPVLADGWTADMDGAADAGKNPFGDDEVDPILEQISQVRRMLERAEAAGRGDEAQSLRSNLEELKEYQRKQSARGFAVGAGSFGQERPRRAKAAPIVVNKNPFLDSLPPPVKRTPSSNANPFLDGPADDSTNPFLAEVHGSNVNTNPFLDDDVRGPGEPRDAVVDDPVFHQICYISKCLDDAIKSGKLDEAAILRDNLKELQSLYDSNR